MSRKRKREKEKKELHDFLLREQENSCWFIYPFFRNACNILYSNYSPNENIAACIIFVIQMELFFIVMLLSRNFY